MERAAVVITNRDYGRYVGAAIDSAIAQSEPCHVIVVDDRSSDDSTSVIAGYRDRITAVSTADDGDDQHGQAAAFNRGFAEVDEPVVLFLDADDLLAPDAIAEVLAAFEESPASVRCQFRLEWIDADGRPIPGGFPEPGRCLPAGDLRAALTTHPADIAWQPTSGNAFRTEGLRRLLPMPAEDYRISADHYLSNLSALYGEVASIERSLGSYRVHGANADHRAGFDLDRTRATLVRTRVTHEHLIEHGRDAGLTMPASPDGFRSLSEAAARLASYRSEPQGRHPFPGDRWVVLVGRALRAATGRTDLALHRRLLAAAWIATLAVVPRALVARVAGLGLTR